MGKQARNPQKVGTIQETKEIKKKVGRKKRKITIYGLFLLLLASHTLGQIDTAGGIVIPTASGDKHYKGRIQITKTEIVIECRENIFHPLNEFDRPRQNKLTIKADDFFKIIVGDNCIFLFPSRQLFRKHRNLCVNIHTSFLTGPDLLVLITFDKYLDDKEKSFIQSIKSGQ